MREISSRVCTPLQLLPRTTQSASGSGACCGLFCVLRLALPRKRAVEFHVISTNCVARHDTTLCWCVCACAHACGRLVAESPGLVACILMHSLCGCRLICLWQTLALSHLADWEQTVSVLSTLHVLCSAVQSSHAVAALQVPPV